MYISKVNWEQVICPLNRGCLLFREFFIRGFNVVYSECLSTIEGPTVLSMHEKVFVWSSVHVMLQEAEKKKKE